MDGVVFGGHYPGVLGRIIELHGGWYHEHWGLDLSFELQVGRELCEFMGRLDPARDGLWTARRAGGFLGSIAVDGLPAEGPRIRWFIVAPQAHGQGVGSGLLDLALGFCRTRAVPRVHLWTFQGLDAARRLYESRGFVLAEEHEADIWGSPRLEQKFVLDLAR